MLSIVKGCQIDFHSTPVQSCRPVTRASFSETQLIDAEFQELLKKGAIQKSVPQTRPFTTVYFLLKERGHLPARDRVEFIKPFCSPRSFSDRGAPLFKDPSKERGLHDKYRSRRHIFFRSNSQILSKVSSFHLRHKHYTFLGLPFVLSSAPRIFTKLLKPVAAFLRKQGYRIVIYLDDVLLLLASSKEEALRLTQMSLSLLQSLGFLINWTKSTLSPVQSITDLGFVISSVNMTIYLPKAKVQRVYAVCNNSLSQPKMSRRQLASLLGTLASCRLAIWVALLHLRALQILLIQTLRNHQFDYNCPVFLNPKSRAELTWWLNNLPKVNGSPVSPPPPDLTILSDALMQGWGATCQGKSTNGEWSSQESIQHINLLKLKAAFLALKTFLKNQSHKVVLLKLDNSAVVAYLNNKGGTLSVPLMSLALEIWTWCLQRNILISAQHVPGKENTIADLESRTFLDSTDWQLDPTVI